MKSLARSYIWWPTIDQQIEQVARACAGCQSVRHMPPTTYHPWERPTTPWRCLHIDFAGPFQNHMFLIVVDAMSKWPEVIKMKSTTAEKTISVLRTMFSRYGIPDVICSDNGHQFVADVLSKFFKSNGIKHVKSQPYHPATNGQAERFVQTFKHAMTAAKEETLDTKLQTFFLMYRNTEHPATRASPSATSTYCLYTR